MDDDHLCGLGVFSPVADWYSLGILIQGHRLIINAREGPGGARDSQVAAPDCMLALLPDTPVRTALLVGSFLEFEMGRRASLRENAVAWSAYLLAGKGIIFPAPTDTLDSMSSYS